MYGLYYSNLEEVYSVVPVYYATPPLVEEDAILLFKAETYQEVEEYRNKLFKD